MKLEDIKVGQYVRTKYGIAKITDIICGQDVKFDNDSIFDDEDMKKHHEYDGISKNDYFFKQEVTKASFNIIDILEVGDYVNGSKVHKIGNCLTIILDTEENISWINPDDIKSIVTHEQMEQMSYKLGE